MTLEVRTAISPTRPQFNRVSLIAKSVREFYPDAIITAWVSPEGERRPEDPPDLGNGDPRDILFKFVPLRAFNRWKYSRYPYIATAARRFAPPFQGDHVLVLDADVMPARRFDELFALDCISGMMAHVAPMGCRDWRRLLAEFDVSANEWHQHSAFGIMDNDPSRRMSPPYFNSGMVFGPRAEMEKLWWPMQTALERLPAMVSDHYWIDQIALALALAMSAAPTVVLPMRWNFANQASFDDAFPGELADVRFLHAMRTDIIDRDRDFETSDSIAALVARRDLTGSNEMLRQRVAELTA